MCHDAGAVQVHAWDLGWFTAIRNGGVLIGYGGGTPE
jgi:hypothetical protein